MLPFVKPVSFLSVTILCLLVLMTVLVSSFIRNTHAMENEPNKEIASPSGTIVLPDLVWEEIVSYVTPLDLPRVELASKYLRKKVRKISTGMYIAPKAHEVYD
jgi:hypothetical protein